MGKTTALREVIIRRGVATIQALPSLSARNIPLGAFAAVLPLPQGDSTSRVAGAISYLRSEHRLVVVDDCHLLDDESATVLHLVSR